MKLINQLMSELQKFDWALKYLFENKIILVRQAMATHSAEMHMPFLSENVRACWKMTENDEK